MRVTSRLIGAVMVLATGVFAASLPQTERRLTRAERHRQKLAERRARAPRTPAIPAAPDASGVDLRLLSIAVSGGNGDGWIQPGETVTLAVSLANFGSAIATGVFAQLDPSATTSPYVTILDKSADWPDIATHGTAQSVAPHFQVQVSNVLPCGSKVELLLDVRAAGFQSLIPVTLDLSRPVALDLVKDVTRRYNESDSVIYAPDASDNLGNAMAMGDVNGDGYADLIVGAPGSQGSGNLKANAGEVWLVYGSASGFLPSIDLFAPPAGTAVIYGADGGDELGVSVAAADVNGDGYDDIVMAAPYGDGPGNTRNIAGEAWVVYGQSAALPASVDLSAPPVATSVIYAPDVEDGMRHVAAGDVNGDGYDDLLLGVPSADGPANARSAAGELWVIYGNGGKLPTSIDLASPPSYAIPVYGAVAGDKLGTSAAAGDVNGDGFDDVVVGAVGSSGKGGKSLSGAAYVIYGKGTPLSSIDLASLPANVAAIYGADAVDTLGKSVAAGDIDGDGRDDVIVGAIFGYGPGNAKTNAGEVWVLYGQAAQLPSTTDLFFPPSNSSVVYGADPGDHLGGGNLNAQQSQSVATGDVNGDGYDDLVLGALDSAGAGNGKLFAGEAWIVLGQSGRLPAAVDLFYPPGNARVVYGADAGDDLGSSVAAGDINHDGFDDVLIGAVVGQGPADNKFGAGEAHVVNGAGTATYWHKAEGYSFINASAGTNLNLACDDCSVAIPIGFGFSFYGERFTTVYVSSNGFLSLAIIDDAASGTPRCISSKSPSSLSSVPLLIAPFWDDLDLRTTGNVYYQLTGTAPDRRLTVEWLNVPHYPNSGAATFEVSLYESTGQILCQYQDVIFGSGSDKGGTAVIGVENRTAAEGTNYGCNQALLLNGQALSFNPNTPIFEDNLESLDTLAGKPGKWTVNAPSFSAWHSVSGGACAPFYHGRLTSFYEGIDISCQYGNNIAGDALNLPQVSGFPADGRLTFWQRFQSEAGFDYGRVQIQGNGGGYSELVAFNGPATAGAWQPQTPLFINNTAGQTVDLRYLFSSEISNVDLGWMVDDVKLVGCNAVGITSSVWSSAFAQPVTYCGNGVNTGHLDAIGSQCGDGSNPLSYQWFEDGAPIPGATSVAYTIPASHAAGTFAFTVTVTCVAGSATSAPQLVSIVAPAQPVGNTLKLAKANGGVDVAYTWTDVAGASDYVVVKDTAPNGAFATIVGSAAAGNPGLTVSMPAGNLLYFKVAGRNPVCGQGPL